MINIYGINIQNKSRHKGHIQRLCLASKDHPQSWEL
jgi:hypothetical protein